MRKDREHMMEDKMRCLRCSIFSVAFSLLLPFIHNRPLRRNQIHLYLVSVQWKLNPTKTKLWFELKMLIFKVDY